MAAVPKAKAKANPVLTALNNLAPPAAKAKAKDLPPQATASALQRANRQDGIHTFPVADAGRMWAVLKATLPANGFPIANLIRMPRAGLAGAVHHFRQPLPAHAGLCLRNLLEEPNNAGNHMRLEALLILTGRYGGTNNMTGL